MAVERWAMIQNGVVINVCLWDGLLTTWQPPEGVLMVKAVDNIGIGWLYDDTTDTWTYAPPENPPGEPPPLDPPV